MHIERHHDQITPELMQLLLTADPDAHAIARYSGDSAMFVAYDASRPVGVALVAPSEQPAELMNIAVDEAHQSKGLAKALIFAICEYARACGSATLVVGTGNSSLAQLALYQKCGFRMQSIEQDHFLSYPEPIFENGIRCLDKVVLCATL